VGSKKQTSEEEEKGARTQQPTSEGEYRYSYNSYDNRKNIGSVKLTTQEYTAEIQAFENAANS